MHVNEEDPKGRPSESTISSDSGVIIEEAVKLNNDAPNNVTITTNITQDNNSTDNTNNSTNTQNNCESGSSYAHHNIIIEDYDDTKSSPISIRSNNISINSLGDSSVIDSDSDFEDAPRGDFIIQKLGQHSSDTNGRDGVVIINQKVDGDPHCNNGVLAAKPQIGSIAVQNSTDITFGNKTFYQGPVTIKQFLLEKEKWRPMENGNDNPAFRGENNNENGVSDKKGNLKTRFYCFKKRNPTCIVAASAVVALVFAGIAYGIYCVAKPSGGEVLDKYELRLVTRDEWKARPPSEDLTPQPTPVVRVIICHTDTVECFSKSSCILRVQFIQNISMSGGGKDIAYNFLVGGDGAVYEGRGWNNVGAHTEGRNTGSNGFAFIGNFETNTPPDIQIKAALAFLDEGVKSNNLINDYKLFAAMTLTNTVSPGKRLYEIIQGWEHWTDEV